VHNSPINHPITRSPNPQIPSRAVRPLLKWAGGKRQLLPELRRFYPTVFVRYIEPFFGSGAVFFDLYASGRLHGRTALLTDANPDLIACYEAVRDAPDDVADALDALARSHARDERAHYYAVRDERFNPLRETRRSADGGIAYTPELAAMFIYLNRTGFNGLYRVNGRGAFNVPLGRYERPNICDRVRLAHVARALAAPGVRLERRSFESAIEIAEAGDFVYADPPYAPLSASANFTSYTSRGFSAGDQQQLQQLVFAAARRGCSILLSNSTAADIVALYDTNAARGAGLRTIAVSARRALNSNAAKRGPVGELLVTNVKSSRGGAAD
jgi:DNA adenine methylase